MWTSEEIAAATGGKVSGKWNASSVTIDSRAVAPGELFIALKGERFDGHGYVVEALKKGAAGAVVSHVPSGVSEAAPLVIVPDTEKALTDLGHFARARSGALFIAVTGSVGKTGTKEALRTAFSALGETYATKGNFNNHLGLPLTLANLPASTRFCILELGMNHAGEMAHLTRIARPDIAIITTIEAAHMEFFDSIEAIADAKAEIFEGMGGEGLGIGHWALVGMEKTSEAIKKTAILNLDNPQFARLKAVAEKAGLRVVSFGANAGAMCRMEEYKPSELGSEVVSVINGTAVSYHLGTIGRHYAVASASVLAAVDAAGEDLAKAAAALAHFHEPSGRGRLQRLPWQGGELTLVDDSYNASPASMAASFEKLAELRRPVKGPARTVAVLGDMLELGKDSIALHVGLVPVLSTHQIDLVFAAGTVMKHLYDALPEAMRGAYAPDAASLMPLLTEALRPGDIVLVKGSHGSRMYEVAAKIGIRH